MLQLWRKKLVWETCLLPELTSVALEKAREISNKLVAQLSLVLAAAGLQEYLTLGVVLYDMCLVFVAGTQLSKIGHPMTQ